MVRLVALAVAGAGVLVTFSGVACSFPSPRPSVTRATAARSDSLSPWISVSQSSTSSLLAAVTADGSISGSDLPLLCNLPRRKFLSTVAALTSTAAIVSATATTAPGPAHAVGPVKINLLNPTYTAIPCPKDKPIPGEKAMKGMKGLCVTVDVDLETAPPQDKDLDKVGVYGYVTDEASGESVLANNPDLSTDAGQFAIVNKIKPNDKKIQFEFIAAVPREMDTSQYRAGIAPLSFQSLRVVSFPGGQQYGAISPCEMNEFSEECEAWEEVNGPYQRGEFMIRSNPRTKGR